MLHPGPLVAASPIQVSVEPGVSPALDRIAEAAHPAHAFLRAAWFEGEGLQTLVGRRDGGEPVAALPLVSRRIGPLALREAAGAYWPYRFLAVRRDATETELSALFTSRVLGRCWRLGPVMADDPALEQVTLAARRTGWTILRRKLATAFVVDLAALRSAGPWPSSKTLRKNRWLENRLAGQGELEFGTVSGEAWDQATFDLLARIEGESWVGRSAKPEDRKFGQVNLPHWKRAVRDPDVAARLGASFLFVGGEPAAFVFTLDAGDTRHIIANSFGERFREASPGRILLYRELQRAMEQGLDRIGWGAGDGGYKSEMGARPGPHLIDLLFVRGALPAALLRLLWR